MKINWGTGIVIAFLAFMSFILYFVWNMSTNDKYNKYDLVTEDYYSEELKYQEIIDKQENAKMDNLKIEWFKTQAGLKFKFPKGLDHKNIKGKVFLYRPSNKQLDFEITISMSDNNLLIPDKRLLDGRWNILIDWRYNGKGYLFKEAIIY